MIDMTRLSADVDAEIDKAEKKISGYQMDLRRVKGLHAKQLMQFIDYQQGRLQAFTTIKVMLEQMKNASVSDS